MKPLKSCSIDIRVKGGIDGKENVFTSGSVISGTVIVTAKYDTAVVTLDVSLAGVTTIALDSMGDFNSSKHQFLSLKMPTLDRHLPCSRTLPAGTVQKIPFDFTVPHRLSISSCVHSKQYPFHLDTIERHTLLPPSSGNWGSQDKVPGRTGIAYFIRAEVVHRLHPGSQEVWTEQAKRPVRVLPALPEDPPLGFPTAGLHHDHDHDHDDGADHIKKTRDTVCSCSTLTACGSPFGFRKVLGRVTASVKQQPRAVRLTRDGCGALGSCVQVRFEFLPFKVGSPPPKIRVKTCKMVATTTYTWTASASHGSPEERRTYTHDSAHPIMYLAPEHVSWTRLGLQQKEGENTRCRGLLASSEPTPISADNMHEAHNAHDDGSCSHLPPHEATPTAKYTMLFTIPFTLLNKGPGFYAPTFHSCLISRVYKLQLNFAVGAKKSTISLVMPLQVIVQAVDNSDATEAEPPSFSSVMAHDDEQRGNENGNSNAPMLRSMSMAEMQRYSSVLPPEYDSGMSV